MHPSETQNERALEAEKVSKCYPRGGDRHWALREVSLGLERGASLGLVGANGAGKSTLLRVLSGATPPSSGRYRTRGRVASLLELGAGFHPDFNARENVLMNGVLLGASRRAVRAATDAVLAFAELEHVAGEPLRTYSSGMAMRLGFAAALSVEPEVLLLDEVFAVGDLVFQKKCVDRLHAFRERGGTLVFASHSLYDLRQMCDRALWLDAGRVMEAGDAAAVTNAYAAWAGSGGGRGTDPRLAPSEPAGAEPAVTAIEVRDAHGVPVEVLASGSDVEIAIWFRNPRPGAALQLGLTLTRQDGTLAAGLGTHLSSADEGRSTLRGARGQVRLRLPRLALLAGTFTVTAHLFDERGVHRWHERVHDSTLRVTNDSREVGLVRLAHRWSQQEEERAA